MSFDVEEYVRYQVANAPVRPYPFPHFYVAPVFPEEFYQRLLAQLPTTDVLEPIGQHGTVGMTDPQSGMFTPTSEPRYIADLSKLEEDEEVSQRGHLWRDVSSWLLGNAFRDLIMQKFRIGITERFGEGAQLMTDVEGRFVRDFHQYQIHPHTDQPAKLVSLLFYLPADDTLRRHGTVIYRPHDPQLRCTGLKRHPFDLFRKVATMSFLPNALFGFLKTEYSFHGVEEIKDERVERNVLLYNIYVRKVRIPQRENPTKSLWPWSRKARAT